LKAISLPNRNIGAKVRSDAYKPNEKFKDTSDWIKNSTLKQIYNLPSAKYKPKSVRIFNDFYQRHRRIGDGGRGARAP